MASSPCARSIIKLSTPLGDQKPCKGWASEPTINSIIGIIRLIVIIFQFNFFIFWIKPLPKESSTIKLDKDTKIILNIIPTRNPISMLNNNTLNGPSSEDNKYGNASIILNRKLIIIREIKLKILELKIKENILSLSSLLNLLSRPKKELTMLIIIKELIENILRCNKE